MAWEVGGEIRDLKTLVASILAHKVTADFHAIYALAVMARDELKLDISITPIIVEAELRALVKEGYVAEYVETSLDMKQREKKYMAMDKLASIAKPLPPKTRAVANFKYVTPTFYVFINYGL